jgi:hypothetical protein
MDCEAGTDLADVYISIHKEKENEPLSKDEIIVQNLASVDPQIYNLIETFGLCDSFDNPFDLKRIKK